MRDAQQRIAELEAQNQALTALVNEQAEQILALRGLVDRFAELAGVPAETKRRGRPRKEKDVVKSPEPKKKGRPSNIPTFLMPVVLKILITYARSGFSTKKSVDAAFDDLWDLFDDPERSQWLRKEMTRKPKGKGFNGTTIGIAKTKWLNSVRELLKNDHD